MCSKTMTMKSTENYWEKIDKIKQLIDESEAIVIGAGAGLSTAAGLHYGGERFQKLFPEFIEAYGLTDMYSAAFYEHKTLEEEWGYWCMHIYHNRYIPELNDTYKKLLNMVKERNYFVITTNGDHLFLSNGFNKERLFYVQGDYGLFQCSVPCHHKTYENKEQVEAMVKARTGLTIPTEHIPRCPKCNEPMVCNLRKDQSFVEGDGWDRAIERYSDFIEKHKEKKVLYLELGIGYNTPSIIKYPFYKLTYQNANASYVCLNMDEEYAPKEIEDRSVCIKANIKTVLEDII